RKQTVFVVSHVCLHSPDAPEFKRFPPHCVRGTPGAEFVPEALTARVARIPNSNDSRLPDNLDDFHQVLLEKQTLDIFESLHAHHLVERLPRHADFVVFGVVTEFCVHFAAKGLLERKRKVFIVEDAIETLAGEHGARSISELKSLGARMISTSEALAKVR